MAYEAEQHTLLPIYPGGGLDAFGLPDGNKRCKYVVSKVSKMKFDQTNQNWVQLKMGYSPVDIVMVIYAHFEGEKHKSNELRTAYIACSSSQKTTIRIDSIDERDSGETTIEGAFIKPDGNEVQISFLDTRFIENGDKYIIGDTYDFCLSGLCYSITRRSEENLSFTPDTGPFKGEKLTTDKMVGLWGSPTVAADFTIFQPFAGYDEGKAFIFPDSGVKYRVYSFKWQPADEDQPWLEFPVYITELAVKGQASAINDPVDIAIQLQGYLAK